MNWRVFNLAAAVLLTGVFLVGSASAEIVCETTPKRVWLIEPPGGVAALGHETTCHELPPTQRELIDDAKAACDLLITAYGKQRGRKRCQDLLRRLDIELAL